MGSPGIPEQLAPGIPGARLRAHEGGSRDPGGIGQAPGALRSGEAHGKVWRRGRVGLLSWAEHPN